MNLDNALIKGSQFFKKKYKIIILDSEILMSKAINKDRKFIILNLGKEIR